MISNNVFLLGKELQTPAPLAVEKMAAERSGQGR